IPSPHAGEPSLYPSPLAGEGEGGGFFIPCRGVSQYALLNPTLVYLFRSARRPVPSIQATFPHEPVSNCLTSQNAVAKSDDGCTMVRLDNCIGDDCVILIELAPRPTRRKARAGLLFSGGSDALGFCTSLRSSP